MLVEYVIESKEGGLLESILMPFDVYNDAADHALRALKQRFLYDEIEAEVIIFFYVFMGRGSTAFPKYMYLMWSLC